MFNVRPAIKREAVCPHPWEAPLTASRPHSSHPSSIHTTPPHQQLSHDLEPGRWGNPYIDSGLFLLPLKRCCSLSTVISEDLREPEWDSGDGGPC